MKRGGKKNQSSGIGCVLFVIILGLLVFVSQNTPPARNSQEGADSDDVGPVFITVTEVANPAENMNNLMTAEDEGEPTGKSTEFYEQFTPLPALTPMWIESNANARACSSTTCAIVVTLPRAEGVKVRTWEHGETINGSDIWYQVEHEGGWVYVHSSLLGFDAPRSTQQQQSVPQQQQQTAPTQAPVNRVPRNCDEAVAMGLSPEQAAQYPKLDRDKDGVACYGD